MKYKKIRQFCRSVKFFLKGYTFHIGKICTVNDIVQFRKEFIKFSLPVKIRPELGEQNQNRIYNMKICCDLIDGTILKRGEIFSLQHMIGEPLVSRGFRTGPVIIKGKLKDAPGGGICQVSTVLFNMALLANLQIIEKHNHSRDIWGEKRMIDLGRDAVYVYLRKDLVFKNTNNFSVIIRMNLDLKELKLTSCLLTCENVVADTVTIETKILQRKDERGKEPSGWVVRTRRKFWKIPGSEVLTYDKIEEYND